MREKLEALRAASSKLNASTDAAAKVVAEVEKFLDKLGIGLSAESDVFRSEPYEDDDQDEAGWRDEDGNDSRPEVCYTLNYGRVGGKFRIHVATSLCGTKLDARGFAVFQERFLDRTIWSSCSREMKIESFAKLPEILGKLTDRAVELSAAADEAAKTVKDVLAAMGEQ